MPLLLASESSPLLLALAGVIILGVVAQWVAWMMRLPSILLLLVIGVAAGPVLGILKPDEQFGDLLLPFVSVAVALILYEGGLSLRLRELADAGPVLWRLVTVGALITWGVCAAAAIFLLGLPPQLGVLLGAVLVVTGPTVIGPLLQHIRPAGPTGRILKWEGIVIDPIGAMLAVLVFEVIASGSLEDATTTASLVVVKTIGIGGLLGLGAAAVLAVLLRQHWIPHELDNAVSVMLVLGAYVASDAVQPESGLLAVTVMGVAMANQRLTDVRHIVEFKENLRVLLISSLFILLAARLDLGALRALGWGSLAFLGVVVVLARPLSVIACTLRSSLTLGERTFLAWMAPRGIVAAAVSSVFALRLQAQGMPMAETLVPLTFVVIIGTVILYGLSAPAVARWLGVADPSPQGVLFVGAQPWLREVAAALQEQGFRVVVVDTNQRNLAAARMLNLPTYGDSILAEHALDELDMGGLGKLIAATPNNGVNVLAVQRLAPVFGRTEVYQLVPAAGDEWTEDADTQMHGRLLFGPEITFHELAARAGRGAVAKATPITATFTFESFREHWGDRAVPMFVVRDGRLLPITADQPVTPQADDVLISLVDDSSEGLG